MVQPLLIPWEGNEIINPAVITGDHCWSLGGHQGNTRGEATIIAGEGQAPRQDVQRVADEVRALAPRPHPGHLQPSGHNAMHVQAAPLHSYGTSVVEKNGPHASGLAARG